jgi:protein-tyrosine phosphatase
MAAAMLRDILDQTGQLSGWRVGSAGTWAVEGRPATSMAVQAMSERGIDISNHRARTVSSDLLGQFDLVLVMTHDHQEALRVEFAHIAQRVHLLSELVNATWDLDDPVGCSMQELRALASFLERVLRDGLERLILLAQSANSSDADSAYWSKYHSYKENTI